MTGKYEDIIQFPRPVSSRHARMSTTDRAAQFSPFAALTGFDATITETGRRTDLRIELEDNQKTVLDQKQQYLAQLLRQQPEVTVTYFVPDCRKSGGSYVQAVGRLKKIDPHERVLLLADGRRIPLDEIIDIDSVLLPDF